MSATILQADIVDWAESYTGEPFHALLCDPPYHLTSIVQRFGKAEAAPAQGDVYARASKGFMGRDWDGGNIAFRPETWYALARHLYPGAFGMAFAGSRGWHRMACAIEDAGLIIHPTIFCWVYGSGFPKATRIDTQLDAAAGVDRPVVGQQVQMGAKFRLTQETIDNGGFNDPQRRSFARTGPATTESAVWEGYRYGLQALKPAVEPIIVFQKPYSGKPVESIAQTGAGALNIAGGRIGDDAVYTRAKGAMASPQAMIGDTGYVGCSASVLPAGRWPSNLALAHHPDCNGSCHPDCTIVRLGLQSGMTKAGGSNNGHASNAIYNTYGTGKPYETRNDTGTAARYFYQADWMLDRLEQSDPMGYFPKVSTAEREAGLDPLYQALMGQDESFTETTVDDGRPTPIDNPYQRGETKRRNIHPTIKPLSLTRWLATLLLPPDRYAPRRLFVPFAGAGSEMIGARLAGWDEVLGIEREADHVAIAQARLRYWESQKDRFDQGQPIMIRLQRSSDQRTFFDDW